MTKGSSIALSILVGGGLMVYVGQKVTEAEKQITRPPSWIDQKARRTIFMSCLTNLPTGPVHVVSDTWDKVVLACDTIAEDQARQETPCEGCVKR